MPCDTQSISIDGVAGPAMEDVARVELHDIELASIFETLEIDKALIGGRATGTFTARQALSPTPILTTDDLHVRIQLLHSGRRRRARRL